MSIFGKKSKKYKLGIALSGGGARGFAHLGILKALHEKGIYADVISGTSAGAIIGAFIGAGKTPDETFEIVSKYKFFDFARIRVPTTGLFKLDNIQTSLRKELSVERIENLKTPLFIAATDMLNGNIKYFNEGPLSRIVQASSSIPVLFSPVEIDGKLYCDGGILDNLPLKPLLSCCNKIIVINISPLLPIKEMKSIVQVATRMFQLSVNAREDEKKKLADFYIEPPEVDKYEILDTKHANKIFEVGYQYTKELDIKI
ncbi:MAG: patatin-like phospholipase family protein [Bacteroidota bacterium]